MEAALFTVMVPGASYVFDPPFNFADKLIATRKSTVIYDNILLLFDNIHPCNMQKKQCHSVQKSRDVEKFVFEKKFRISRKHFCFSGLCDSHSLMTPPPPFSLDCVIEKSDGSPNEMPFEIPRNWPGVTDFV